MNNLTYKGIKPITPAQPNLQPQQQDNDKSRQ